MEEQTTAMAVVMASHPRVERVPGIPGGAPVGTGEGVAMDWVIQGARPVGAGMTALPETMGPRAAAVETTPRDSSSPRSFSSARSTRLRAASSVAPSE